MPSSRHDEIERRMRDLLADADLPAPDEVVCEPEAVMFVGHDSQTVVCVDLDDPPELAVQHMPLDRSIDLAGTVERREA